MTAPVFTPPLIVNKYIINYAKPSDAHTIFDITSHAHVRALRINISIPIHVFNCPHSTPNPAATLPPDQFLFSCFSSARTEADYTLDDSFWNDESPVGKCGPPGFVLFMMLLLLLLPLL